MKVAISTDNNTVSAHFGRCPQFTFAEIQDGEIKDVTVMENPGHEPGFLPEFLHRNGAEYIIAGGMGQRARMLFDAKSIKTILGVSGTIEQALTQLCSGTLTGGESFCSPGEGKGYGLDKAECDHEAHQV